FFFSSRRRHTRFSRDWSSDVCSSDLGLLALVVSLGALLLLALRPLTLLPLGETSASSLGLRVPRARLLLLVLAAVLTAASTVVIGPLSFVGLIRSEARRVGKGGGAGGS